jgi:hypothetical protein
LPGVACPDHRRTPATPDARRYRPRRTHLSERNLATSTSVPNLTWGSSRYPATGHQPVAGWAQGA